MLLKKQQTLTIEKHNPFFTSCILVSKVKLWFFTTFSFWVNYNDLQIEIKEKKNINKQNYIKLMFSF